MNKWTRLLSASFLLMTVSATYAQQQGGPPGGGGGAGGPPGGGFGGPGGPGGPDHDGPPDPQQMQAMMDKRIQQNLDLSDDAWAKLQPLVDKVQELAHQNDTGPRMHGRPHRDDDDNAGPDQQDDRPKTSVESAIADLKKVLSDKSSTDEKVQAATKVVEDAEKKSADDLADARKALKAAVNTRQLAVLVAMGVLN